MAVELLCYLKEARNIKRQIQKALRRNFRRKHDGAILFERGSDLHRHKPTLSLLNSSASVSWHHSAHPTLREGMLRFRRRKQLALSWVVPCRRDCTILLLDLACLYTLIEFNCLKEILPPGSINQKKRRTLARRSLFGDSSIATFFLRLPPILIWWLHAYDRAEGAKKSLQTFA